MPGHAGKSTCGRGQVEPGAGVQHAAQSVPASLRANFGYPVRHRLAGRRLVPPTRRREDSAGDNQGRQVVLFDHVLSSDLSCPQTARTDPASDCFGVLARAPRRLGHRYHCMILLHVETASSSATASVDDATRRSLHASRGAPRSTRLLIPQIGGRRPSRQLDTYQGGASRGNIGKCFTLSVARFAPCRSAVAATA